MAYASIKTRLKKAQRNATGGEDQAIVSAIRQGAFYDELEDALKDAYCAYHGTDRHAMEEINLLVTGTLHFPVEGKGKPLTEAQFLERVDEVEALVLEGEQ